MRQSAEDISYQPIDRVGVKCYLFFEVRCWFSELLMIDELGFVPLSNTGAELLFEVFSRR
jgi:hypothetical protein